MRLLVKTRWSQPGQSCHRALTSSIVSSQRRSVDALKGWIREANYLKNGSAPLVQFRLMVVGAQARRARTRPSRGKRKRQKSGKETDASSRHAPTPRPLHFRPAGSAPVGSAPAGSAPAGSAAPTEDQSIAARPSQSSKKVWKCLHTRPRGSRLAPWWARRWQKNNGALWRVGLVPHRFGKSFAACCRCVVADAQRQRSSGCTRFSGPTTKKSMLKQSAHQIASACVRRRPRTEPATVAGSTGSCSRRQDRSQ